MIYLLFSLALANLDFAPPSFTTPQNEQIVYVDILSAHYAWSFTAGDHNIKSQIHFIQRQKGKPVIESVQKILAATINGKSIRTREVLQPTRQTNQNNYLVRILDIELEPGQYELNLEHKIQDYGPTWSTNGAPTFLMDMWDVQTHRGMMERFLPTNLPYDTFKTSMSFDFSAIDTDIEVFSNGNRVRKQNSIWEIEFNESYNSHSIYLHFGPKANYHIQDFTIQSVDGRNLPVKLYMKTSHATPGFIQQAKQQTLLDFAFVEKTFGAFPHEKVVIFIRPGSGGMEYAGATTTGISSLRHELIHSYYARSVRPIHGNANWIDEAVATLIDENVTTTVKKPLGLSSHNPYFRDTLITSYQEGAEFLYLLHTKIKAINPLKSIYEFLRLYFNENKDALITTQEFQLELEAYHGQSLESEFSYYLYTPLTGITKSEKTMSIHHKPTTSDLW